MFNDLGLKDRNPSFIRGYSCTLLTASPWTLGQSVHQKQHSLWEINSTEHPRVHSQNKGLCTLISVFGVRLRAPSLLTLLFGSISALPPSLPLSISLLWRRPLSNITTLSSSSSTTYPPNPPHLPSVFVSANLKKGKSKNRGLQLWRQECYIAEEKSWKSKYRGKTPGFYAFKTYKMNAFFSSPRLT